MDVIFFIHIPFHLDVFVKLMKFKKFNSLKKSNEHKLNDLKLIK
jgi:hypothetical protein